MPAPAAGLLARLVVAVNVMPFRLVEMLTFALVLEPS